MSSNQDENSAESPADKIERINDYSLPHKYIFRICIVGDPNVGKSSILTRFCDNTFKENYNNTIGVDFRVVTLKYNDIIVKLHMWDTAGQERFRSLAVNYFKSSNGFIFVYDITNQDSFNSINSWVNLVANHNKNSIVNILIGNKCDKEEERSIEKDEGEHLAEEKQFYFLETSAKKNENIEKIFEVFVKGFVDYYSRNEYVEADNLQLTCSKTEDIATVRDGGSKCKC